MANLSVDMIRESLSDYPINNYLIDGEEMTDTFLTMCMDYGLDTFNNMSPRTAFTRATMPSSSILLYATLYHAYALKAALLARNTMQYSDGGLQVPIEERSELYTNIANNFRALFQPAAKELKIEMNMESGWGGISSDEAIFPIW